MALPTDIASIESAADFDDGSHSYLFYTNTDGSIAYYVSNTTTESNKTTYNPSSIKIAGKYVYSAPRRVSAVSYTYNHQKEIRVYYVTRETTGTGPVRYLLNELCKTGKGDWYDGELNSNPVYCSERCSITANVGEGQHNLKVFFKNEQNVPSIAWVGLGETQWTNRRLNGVSYDD
ncbi:hypothetical protein M426DRAFT_257507 [Hypoxylon sp. CI-4A]|nr:hypothetical protein M426DRAFT_257507 [Hypoxylon sp. CI-4A]